MPRRGRNRAGAPDRHGRQAQHHGGRAPTGGERNGNYIGYTCLRAVAFALALLLLACASAQEAETSDLSALYEFAEAYGIDVPLDAVAELARQPDSFSADELLRRLKAWIREPAEELLALAAGMFPSVVFLILLRAMLPDASGGTGAAVFLIRLHLAAGFTGAILDVIADAAECLNAALQFSDVVSPILTTLLTSSGLTGSSSLISPAAALTANIIESVFLKYCIPLCRFALCCAIAGNLSKAISLKPVYQLLKKTVNWGTGLMITIFTAFLSLQSSMVYSADGVGLRTAKYAVDSMGSIIGSGISDAWDTYVSGMMVARNTAGISGIAVILGLNALPVVKAAGCMLMLKLFAAAAEILGERETASLVEQMSGVCQMTVSVLVGGMAAVTILMTAAMAAGGSIFG